MTRGNRDFLLGVLFGFIGIGLYGFMLTGFEYVYIEDIIDAIKQLAMPFVFTEIITAIGVEGVRNIRFEFKRLKEKLINKKTKKAEA